MVSAFMTTEGKRRKGGKMEIQPYSLALYGGRRKSFFLGGREVRTTPSQGSNGGGKGEAVIQIFSLHNQEGEKKREEKSPVHHDSLLGKGEEIEDYAYLLSSR